MSYLGSWKIDDPIVFVVTTHTPSTGAATDADAVPSYHVYEDETSTPLITGTMALLNGANTVGFYSEQITLSAANGFEKGKSYSIYITATVGGVTGVTYRNFQIEAEVDSNSVSNLNANVITAASIATDAIDADALAASALAEINAEVDTALADYDAPTSAELVSEINSVQSDIAAVQADTDNIQTRLPASLVSGRMDASVGAMASGVVTAAAIATDAIDADALAADAIAEINATVDTALADYDAPTSAELVSEINSVQSDIAALNNLSAAQVNAEVDSAIETYHLDHLLATDYDPANKPGVATALLNEMVENDGGVSRYTANALEQAPTGGSAPTASEIADAVWDEDATAHQTQGTFGQAIGDPGADTDTIFALANSIQADTDNIQTRLPATLVSGRMDSSVGAMAANVITASVIDSNAIGSGSIGPGAIGASELATDAVNEIAAAVWDEAKAGHVAAGSFGEEVQSHATNAEVVADGDVTQAAIAALNNLSAAQVLTQVSSGLATYDGPTHAELVSEINSVQADIAALNNPSLSAIADAVLDEIFEGTLTLRQGLRLFLAVLAGESNGGGTNTVNFRDNADALNRVQATLDASGNRTAVTLNVT